MPHAKKHLSQRKRQNSGEGLAIMRELVRRGFVDKVDVDDLRRIMISMELRDRRTHDSWVDYFVVKKWLIPTGIETLYEVRVPAAIDITAYLEPEA